MALRTTGGGGNIALGRVGALPWYNSWNNIAAPTCLLCASD